MTRSPRKPTPRRRQRPPTTIGSFPFEILTVIFFMIHDMTTSQLDWVRLAWVCSNWRQAALGSQLIWTRLSIPRLDDHSLVSDLLSRSGVLDLELEIDITAYDTKLIVALLTHNAYRFCSLSLTFHYDQTSGVQEVLHTVKSKLTTLSLQAIYDPATSNDAISTLLLCPFAHRALRNLSISGLRVDAAQSILSALVSLELRDSNDDRFRTVARWVYDTLDACSPTLEQLTMAYVTSLYVRLPNVIPPAMFFPRLRKLKVQDNTRSAIQDFLAFARFPLTTSLDLRNTWHDVQQPVTPRTPLFAGVIFPSWLHLIIAAVPILHHTNMLCLQAGKSFYATGRANNEEETKWRATADLRDLTNALSKSLRCPMAQQLPEVVNVNAVQELHLHLPPDLREYGVLPTVLERFVHLHKLTVGATSAAGEALEALAFSPQGWQFRPGVMEQMTLCVPALADTTIKRLYGLKKQRLSQGKKVLPPVLSFCFPKNLEGCRQTSAAIARLRTVMARITRVEAQFHDCGFCHRKQKPKPPTSKAIEQAIL